MGPLGTFLSLRGRDPEDLKEGHMSTARERAAMELRRKLSAGDDHGTIYLDHSPPPMPPAETGIMGGFFQQPQGPAPQTMPFRPPEQGVAALPPDVIRGILAQHLGGR